MCIAYALVICIHIIKVVSHFSYNFNVINIQYHLEIITKMMPLCRYYW